MERIASFESKHKKYYANGVIWVKKIHGNCIIFDKIQKIVCKWFDFGQNTNNYEANDIMLVKMQEIIEQMASF